MPLDRSARADQVGRLFAHAGEPLVYEGLSFAASISPHQPPVSEAHRNVGDLTALLVKAARAVFGAKLPRQGQHFTDADGRILRIQSVPPSVPTLPTIDFICAAAAASP